MKLILAGTLFVISSQVSAFCDKNIKGLTFINSSTCQGANKYEDIFYYHPQESLNLSIKGKIYEGCFPVNMIWEEYDGEGNLVRANNAEWGMVAEANKHYRLKVASYQEDTSVPCSYKIVVGPDLEE